LIVENRCRLKPIEFSHKDNRGHYYWRFKCDCGKEITTQKNHVVSGHTKSCGCLRIESLTKHGMRNHPAYSVWSSMVNRCHNESEREYEHYQGKGIVVCREWRESPKVFIKWLEDNGWNSKLQIDRINGSGDYEPSNCRVVSRRINNLNKGHYKTNRSGFVGVSKRSDSSTWRAEISVHKKKYCLGNHGTAYEAVAVRDRFIINNSLQGEYKLQVLKPGESQSFRLMKVEG